MIARNSIACVSAATLFLSACSHHFASPSPVADIETVNRVHVRKIVQSSDIATIADRHELVVGAAGVEMPMPREVAWQTGKPGWTVRTSAKQPKETGSPKQASAIPEKSIKEPVRTNIKLNATASSQKRDPGAGGKAKITADTLRSADQKDRGPMIEQTIFVGDVLFEEGSATPKDENITAITAAIRQHGNPLRITVIGHADRNENEGLRQALSLSRAESVAEKLIDAGYEGTVETAGKGDQFIIGDPDSEEGRLSNRRAEVLLSLSK